MIATLTLPQMEQSKCDAEVKERNQSRANDNVTDIQEDVYKILSVEDRKAEFLERMAKERAEKEQKEETEKVESPETQAEESRILSPEERKQEFLDWMQSERELKPDSGKDRGREE